MSSANPKGHEPSMEEILASIRRIISDDQDSFASARPVVDLYAVEAEQDEPQDPSPETSSVDAPDDEEAADPIDAATPAVLAAPDPDPQPDGSTGRPTLPIADPPLLSEAVSASIAGTFDRLEARSAIGGAPSFEETVKEMMRPMLKAWLDQNLPGIVERLVQAEIERVTRP